jgi:serine phosphatase RsbU (regulator of sigma subunit)
VQGQLANLGIGVAMAALAGVALFSYRAYREEAISLVIERDRQVASLSAARIRDELRGFTEVLEALARDREIYRGNPIEQAQELYRVRSRLAVFDGGVVVLDSQGRVRAAEPDRPELEMQDWSSREFFRRLLTSTRPVYSDVTTDGPGGGLVVLIGVPLAGPQNEFTGALAGMFRLGSPTVSAFYANIVRLRLGQTGSTYVLDSRGMILYDSTSELEGQLLNMGSGITSSVVTDSGAARMRGTQGNDVVVAYSPIPGTDWLLVLENDWRTLTRPATRYATILLVTLLAGMGLPSLTLMLLIRRRSTNLRAQEHEAMEDHMVRLVQQALMPKRLPVLPGWDFQLHHRAGDLDGQGIFDASITPEGKLAFSLGKAESRGVRAGILMATVRTALRGAAHASLPAHEALAQCNRLISSEAWPGQGLTLIYAVLDPTIGQVDLASAGHGLAYLASRGDLVELEPSGAALGTALEDDYAQLTVMMEPGDSLILCSRAAAEALSPIGQEFGAERMREILRQSPDVEEGLVARLVAGVAEFTGRSRSGPDLTLVTLVRRRDPA